MKLFEEFKTSVKINSDLQVVFALTSDSDYLVFMKKIKYHSSQNKGERVLIISVAVALLSIDGRVYFRYRNLKSNYLANFTSMFIF